MAKFYHIILIKLLILFSVYSVKGQEYTITQILNNGNTESTYTLVVMAEAYTQSELSDFISHAHLVDDILALNPVHQNQLNNMNIYAISTPSIDGSISEIALNPSSTDPIQTTSAKDTYFGLKYVNSYRAYGLEDSTIYKARRVAAEHIPFVDNVLILVNASQGQPISGRATYFENVAVAGVGSNFSTSREKYILIHELAHSLGGLSDAYSVYPAEGFNTTTYNDPLTIRWNNLLSDPNVGVESINPGIYIPNSSCVMSQTDYSYLCPVCASRLDNVISTDKDEKIPGVHRVYVLSEDLSNNVFQFGWDSIDGASHYEVVYEDNDFIANTKTSYIEIVTTNQVTFDFPGSTPLNYSYNVNIRAFNANYSTHFHNHEAAMQSTPVVFQAPYNISISNVTSKSFKLEWDSNVNSQASLVRLWNQNQVFSEVLTEINTLTFNNLEEGQQYDVEIAAIEPLDVTLNTSSPFSDLVSISLAPLSTDDTEYSDEITLVQNQKMNHISINGLTHVVDYNIYNLRGQSVSNGSISMVKNEINIENLLNGLYFIRLNNNQAIKFLKK